MVLNESEKSLFKMAHLSVARFILTGGGTKTTGTALLGFGCDPHVLTGICTGQTNNPTLGIKKTVFTNVKNISLDRLIIERDGRNANLAYNESSAVFNGLNVEGY